MERGEEQALEYESLRDEINQASLQKTTVEMTLFTVSVAVVSAGVAGAVNANNPFGAAMMSWICLSAYIFVVLMQCNIGSKNRAMTRCGAYLLVNYSLSDNDAKSLYEKRWEKSDLEKMAGGNWELSYRLASTSFGKEAKNRRLKKACARIRLSRFVYRHTGEALSAIILIGVVACYWLAAFLPSGLTLPLYAYLPLAVAVFVPIAEIVLAACERCQEERMYASIDKEENIALRNFYKINNDFTFAVFAEKFLSLRMGD